MCNVLFHVVRTEIRLQVHAQEYRIPFSFSCHAFATLPLSHLTDNSIQCRGHQQVQTLHKQRAHKPSVLHLEEVWRAISVHRCVWGKTSVIISSGGLIVQRMTHREWARTNWPLTMNAVQGLKGSSGVKLEMKSPANCTFIISSFSSFKGSTFRPLPPSSSSSILTALLPLLLSPPSLIWLATCISELLGTVSPVAVVGEGRGSVGWVGELVQSSDSSALKRVSL